MLLVGECIKNLSAEASCEEFCQAITNIISSIYVKNHISTQLIAEHPEERLTCSAIIYSSSRHEIWMIGDCQCLVDGVLYDNPKPQEEKNAEKRIAYIQEHNIREEDILEHDEGRDHIINDIINSMHYQNKTFSVIDGTPVYMEGVKHINVSNAHEIVLASDGYPFLHSTLKESEAALHKILSEDPCCLHLYKATKAKMKGQKSFDDRAYLRFHV